MWLNQRQLRIVDYLREEKRADSRQNTSRNAA